MKKIIIAVLAITAGRAYAADFAGLQTLNAADIAVAAESYRAPAPVKEMAVSPKADPRLKTAVLKISGYSERELDGKFLNASELTDLAGQLNYIAALPNKDIPVELLGYLEGISLSIQDLLPRGPVGRNIAPALKAARALHSKVTSIRQPEKALRGNAGFAVGDVSIKIEALNFTPAAVTASLACRFNDGSGGVESRPEQELAVKVSGEGSIRQVAISAGRLSHFGLFSSPKSCRYVLSVRSAAGTSGDFTLAGSTFNMTREELDALLSDTKLNEKISAQNQPLRLVERNGYIAKP